MELQTKLQNFINETVKYVEKNGSAVYTCRNHSGWDIDIYNNRNEINDALIRRGYEVTSKIKLGSSDIIITRINLQ